MPCRPHALLTLLRARPHALLTLMRARPHALLTLLLARPHALLTLLLALGAAVGAACGEVEHPTPPRDGLPDLDPTTDAGTDAGADAALAPAQRVVVLAADETTFKATLYAFDRGAAGWSQAFSHPVTLGKNGLAWGRGLHDPAQIPPGATLKQEGDGRSPMGLFALTRAWGYPPPASVKTKLPYAAATDKLICVDDVSSKHYNQVIDWQAEGLDGSNLPSHEQMLLSSDLYKYTIFVAHNASQPKPGAGSCIFLHLWSHSDGYTAGCTAMAEPAMLQLLGWLDPARSPLLVQLSRAQHKRLKESWKLPSIP